MHPKSQLKHFLTDTISWGSHSSVCKRRGPKVVVVRARARYRLLLDMLTLLPVAEQDAVQVFCRTFIFIIMQSKKISISNNIRRQSVRFDEIINRNTWHCIERKSEVHRFWQRNSLSDSDILTLTGLTRTHFDDLCGQIHKNSERNLKRFSKSKCTYISGDISYKVVCNAKQNFVYFILSAKWFCPACYLICAGMIRVPTAMCRQALVCTLENMTL